jgi:hypothetical protein
MHGWFNSRFATPPDRFSEQHDHTLKLIAQNLDPGSLASLSKASHRTHDILTDPAHLADIQLSILRSQWGPEDVSYALASRFNLYGDTVSLGEYLRRLNTAIAAEDFDDFTNYSRVYRVIYEVFKRHLDARAADELEQRILLAAKQHVDSAICFDGKILDRPLENTGYHNPTFMYDVLVDHRFVRNSRHTWQVVPCASLRACKYIFEKLSPLSPGDTRDVIVAAVHEANYRGHSSVSERAIDAAQEIFQPDFVSGTINA